MKLDEIKKFIEDNKDKLPLSYNNIVIQKTGNDIILNETKLLKRKFMVNNFNKAISRF
ncbi:MAG: hypothetical protein ABIQ27_04955 [Flavobacterium sp.]|uniref:hypothetical protein n=1 Tax=Flavobacterium sp. TaxID=239 RepID=UPI003266750F